MAITKQKKIGSTKSMWYEMCNRHKNLTIRITI